MLNKGETLGQMSAQFCAGSFGRVVDEGNPEAED